MEFGQVIKKRRMVRAFTSDPLDPGVMQRVLTAANRAPSAGFSQGYALLVLDEPGQLGPFWELLAADADDPDGAQAYDAVRRAPLVIVPLSCKDIYLDRYAREDKGWTDRDEARWPVPYWDIDTGFVGIPPALIPRFRDQFGVPGSYSPIGAVAIGHPDPANDQGGSSRVIRRRSLDELVHRGRW